MAYVDGFVIPVPKNKVEDYRKVATEAARVWREYGALEVHECIGDDVKPGEVTSFPQSVQLKADEVVFFSWIKYESREDRDRINEKVMADPRIKGQDPNHMPFDGKRMIFGGFESFVDV